MKKQKTKDEDWGRKHILVSGVIKQSQKSYMLCGLNVLHNEVMYTYMQDSTGILCIYVYIVLYVYILYIVYINCVYRYTVCIFVYIHNI